MVTPAQQPRPDQPVVDRGGLVTRAWADYFLRMASEQSSEDLRALYEQLAARVAALEGEEALSFRIVGPQSVSVNGIPQPGGAVVITLQNDADEPGNTAYYGTGPDGAKGWYQLADGFDVASGELTKAVDADGVSTFGLADVPDAGTGVLQKTQFDGKGRKTGTASATTDDLPEGAINLYFPEAPQDGRQYAREDGAWEVVNGGIPEAPPNGYPHARNSGAWQPLDGPGSPFVLLKLPVLTDQSGRVLTDQQGRVLLANAPQIPFAWLVGAQAAVKQVYPLSALPPVTPFPREIYVSGTSGVSGIIPAYSDGVNWLRFSDNTPVN